MLDAAGQRTALVDPDQGSAGARGAASTPRSSATCASAYAQHVYKAQGRTVDRAFVLTGGWQTDRERAYVALTRARERTDIYVSREDLGEQGMDAGAIERLGEAMAESHAQEASVSQSEHGQHCEAASRSEAGRATSDFVSVDHGDGLDRGAESL